MCHMIMKCNVFPSNLRLLTFWKEFGVHYKIFTFKYGIYCREKLDYRGSVSFQEYQRFYQSDFFFLVKKKKKETFISLSIKALTTISAGNAMYQWTETERSIKILFSKTKFRRDTFSARFSRKEKKEKGRLIARDISKLSRLRIDVNIYCLSISGNR